MAKMKFAYPIEEVHGKLKGTFGSAVNPGNKKGEVYYHTVNYGKRKTDVTADEQTARDKFKAIAALVATRRKNSQQRVTDQIAFKAQSTYPTLTSYLWSVCKAQYLASQQED